MIKPITAQANQGILMQISPEQIINAVKNLAKTQQDNLIEELLAAVNPDYLASIKTARADYQQGRVFSHQDVFGGL